jgi:hypothetical protein
MQDYQIHTTASARGCHLTDLYITSNTCCDEVIERANSIMPGSPGHVRCLRPYPPSRRRRLNS